MTADQYLARGESGETTVVPVIDIGPYLRGEDGAGTVVEQIRHACAEVGFFVLSGHDVTPELLGRMRAVSSAFFDLPDEEKRRHTSVPGETMGYVPMGRENLAATLDLDRPADLKEIFDIRRPDLPDDPYYGSRMGRRLFRPFEWPARPDGFARTWTEYYRAVESLAARVMEVFALALELPADYVTDKTDRSVDYLRVTNYPAQDTPPAPGQLRAGEHTDYGTLTLVATEDVPGGLQVRTRSGEWADVPHVPDSFVVNIGDMMAQWTNDAWVSTLHRVANPDTGAASARRQSVVFFQNPNYDTVIAPIETCVTPADPARYEPVPAGEWLLNKVTKQRA